MSRLPPPYGTLIDRSRPVRFTFEGRAYSGFEGDTVASALAGAGQWTLSRSFKFQRPRGLVSLAGAEANTLVQLPGNPNVLAERAPIVEGLAVSAQNLSHSLDSDRPGILDRLGRFLPVGFYYRSFMGPTRDSWGRFWEPLIRRKSGLGFVEPRAAPPQFSSSYLHADVLVVGAGLAGLAAAVASAEAGADVILCDENAELGGAQTYWEPGSADVSALVERARQSARIRILARTVCNGWFEDNYLPLIQGEHLFRVRARSVIFATGVIEQPAIFRNNDLPGILLGDAALRLMHWHAVRPGDRAVVLAASMDGYRVALELAKAGVEVAALVDPRSQGGGAWDSEMARQGVPILRGATIEEASGNGRGGRLAKVRVNGVWMNCDLLAVCAGSVPAWQLPCQAGAKLRYDQERARFRLTTGDAPIELAGSLNGLRSSAAIVEDGRRAAGAALARLGRASPAPEPAPPADDEAPDFELPIRAHPRGRDFVDLDEDLQVSDIVNAVAEGYRELELVKRFSTVGMGPSQGRLSALAAARIVAASTGRHVGEVGFTTARPPTGPEMLGVLATEGGPVERRTALHARHIALGAQMRPVGGWRRPYLYGEATARDELIRQEIAAVRQGAGMLDVSTLGKLEVRGPQAGAFLDNLYTMSHAGQPVGRVRYALMLNEMGAVLDDGVVFRLDEDRYYVTATTGAVSRVYADMLFWNAQWRMNVDVLNLTSAFSGVNVTGPLARQVLGALESDIDFSGAAFRYLDGREGHVAGVPVRAMRIGFTGELSYELHCPSSLAVALWDAIASVGAASGLRPYGLEASRMLRLEKRHLLIGQDTDALSTPAELGLDWAVSARKSFFVGKRSIEMRARLGEPRRLVGLVFEGGAAQIPEEGCLVLKDGAPAGHVTSVGYSPTLARHIGLAFVPAEDAVEGRPIVLKCGDGTTVEAPASLRAFYDPDNLRQGL